MCGGRIWGAIAGLIGAFATYFIINFFGFTVDPDDAKLIAFVVGLGIFLLPNLIFKSSPPVPDNSISITKKKSEWENIIQLIDLDCQSKGEKWIEWGNTIKGIIQACIYKVSSPDKNVAVIMRLENWNTIQKIIEPKG